MYRVEVSKETGGLMAEEYLYFTKEKQPHAIEPRAFVLDLYRLVCMVSASRDVARRGLTALTISMIQGGFFKSEVTRILISCAAGLRNPIRSIA